MSMKKTLCFLLLSLLLLFTGCGTTGGNSSAPTRNITAVALSDNQQKLADGIWAAKSLWSGCDELSIYKHKGEYYLAANMPVGESYVDAFDGGRSKVTTYKRYAYRISDGQIIDDLTLADAGVTSVGTKIASVWFQKGDSETVKKALISQLAAKYPA